MTFETLMKREQEQYKETFYHDVGYAIYYILIFFTYSFAILVVVDREGMLMFCYMNMFMLTMNTKICPLFLIKEKGKQCNLFTKYLYTAVSMKMLLRVKLALMVKMIAKASLIAQILTLTGIGIELSVKKSAGESLFIPVQELPCVICPVLVGMIAMLLFGTQMYVYYRKAMKE